MLRALVSDEEHEYLTEGDMINKTIQKRLDCLFTFMTRFYKQVPNEVKKPKLEQGERVIIRLDRKELRQLEQADIKEPDYIKCREYMLFLAFTGLRFGDFIKIDRSFYSQETNELVLTTQKTNSNCRIFLFEGRMISVIGAVIGILIGLLLCWLQQQFGIVRLGSSEGNFVVDAYPVSVHPWDIVVIFFTVIVVGFLSVWYPVRYFARRLLH